MYQKLIVIFSARPVTTDLQLTINGEIIHRATSVKYLGVYLDERHGAYIFKNCVRN
jgi:hypothetical protein